MWRHGLANYVRMAEERPVERRWTSCAIENLRRRIDVLDESLVRLLNARAACALEIGRAEERMRHRDLPAGARGGSARARAANQHRAARPRAIKRLFERIIDEARRLEREAEPEDGKEDQT